MNINLYTYTHIYTIYTNRKMYRQTGVLIYALCILYIYIYIHVMYIINALSFIMTQQKSSPSSFKQTITLNEQYNGFFFVDVGWSEVT